MWLSLIRARSFCSACLLSKHRAHSWSDVDKSRQSLLDTRPSYADWCGRPAVPLTGRSSRAVRSELEERLLGGADRRFLSKDFDGERFHLSAREREVAAARGPKQSGGGGDDHATTSFPVCLHDASICTGITFRFFFFFSQFLVLFRYFGASIEATREEIEAELHVGKVAARMPSGGDLLTARTFCGR
ncbi:hypothetical protein MRX96_036119 [Rhipicephalus microplus]